MNPIVQVSAYYPPHLGGQENAVRDLAQQLAYAGHSVHVLTSTRGGGPKGCATEDGVVVQRLPGLVFGHAPIMPGFARALFRAITPNTVVHLHIGQAFTPEVVWLVSKLRPFPYIAQLHIDFKPSGPAGILLPLYKKLILKHVLQSATAVIVLNKKTLRTVRNTYNYKGTLRLMNDGINEAYFQLSRRPLKPKPPRVLKLLFVGRLSPQKNIDELLKALKITTKRVHLDLVGDGVLQSSIQKTIAELKLKNVTLRGRLTQAEVMELYKTHDALIMPSLYEAQPLVLLESMAARIPIIGTNVIGVAEHIKDAGIIVEPTAQGLVKGIEQYYANYHLLPDMVARAYNTATKFRWDHTLKKYQKLYATAAKT